MATGAIAFDEPIPDEFINMALTSVLMHEVRNPRRPDGHKPQLPVTIASRLAQLSLCVGMQVGHTLGLRHNFRGSTYFAHDELGDTEFMNSTERHGTAAGAITSSIMDCKLSS